ncbi:MAG TPA: choice-of-anchor V domain-containing protein [Candidatus Eisenbacteria bacterium]
MKVSTLVVVLAFLILLGSIIFATTKPHEATAFSTAPPVANTGAPSEGTCVTCHSGTGGSGTIGMALVDFQQTYVPGQTDTLVIAMGHGPGGHVGQSRWGFELTALKTSDNSMAGTFAPTADSPIQTASATSGGRIYMGHRSNGAIGPLNPDDGTEWGLPIGGWLVEWTPPGPGSGPVTFYVAGVEADADGAAGDTDTTYTATYTVQEQGASPVTSTTWGKIKTRFH